MTTLKWDHAVQFVNQPEEAIPPVSYCTLNDTVWLKERTTSA